MAMEGTGQDAARLERNMGLVSGIALIVGTIIASQPHDITSPPLADNKVKVTLNINGSSSSEVVIVQFDSVACVYQLHTGIDKGSGIFISPKGMLEGCGSVGLTLFLWLACGILATMGALVYAELGTAVPQSGGEHAYLLYTFNRKKKKGGIGRVPAFLYDWMGLLIIRPTMFAIISLAFGLYVVKPFFPDCSPPQVLVKLVTAVGMCAIGLLNCYSVRAATRLQNICTFAKLAALVIIAIGGIVVLARGDTENLQNGFEDTSDSPGTVAIAFYNGLWAFDGWNSLNFVTEELKNPSRNLPLSILIGIPLVTGCYVLANIGYFAVLSKSEILASHAVAVRWGDLLLGPMSWLMPAFVVISTLGAANGCLFSSARLAYAAGRDQHFPSVLGFINIRWVTPVPATLFTIIIALILIIPGDLGLLIDIFIFASWLFYGWTTLSLLILRYREPNLPRPYKVPIVVPIIVLMACVYLLLAPIIRDPAGSGSYTLLFLVIGLIAYVPAVAMNIRIPGAVQLTTFLQKLLYIVPSVNSGADSDKTEQ